MGVRTGEHAMNAGQDGRHPCNLWSGLPPPDPRSHLLVRIQLKIHDQRQVVGGAAGDVGVRRVAVVDVEVAAVVHAVERPHG